MPQTTRSTPRSAAKFGRGTPTTSSGRFSRGTPSASSGRFARPQGSPARPRRTPTRTTSRTSTQRFGRMPGRKAKQQKGVAGLIGGLLPTGAASKVTPSSKTGKAGGIAALAGAAGVAFRNRDKLTALLGRKGGAEDRETPVTTPATTPVSPAPQTTPPGTGPERIEPPL